MEDMEIDPDIAAAMGFSSFGHKPSGKKRKLDHEEADSRASTGANSMQLGVRQKMPTYDALHATKKPLEDHSHATELSIDEGLNQSEAYSDALIDQPQSITNDPETHISDGPESKGKQKESHAPSGLAQFLDRGKSFQPKQLQNKVTQQESSSATTALSDSLGLSSDVAHSQAGRFGSHDLQALRKGLRNAQGDIAYFLPSFIEDPWRDLGESH